MKPSAPGQEAGQIERAAHLLTMLAASGLALTEPWRLNAVLLVIADALAQRRSIRSHADAAATLLDELERLHAVTVPPDRRRRALAILGSAIGAYS